MQAPAGPDALLPREMALRAEEIGVRKAALDAPATFVLAVLAGSFIALGAMFATIATTGTAGVVPYGISRLLAGTVFCLGLVLVIVGGAELFTGNTLIIMAWVSGKLSLGRLLRNWGLVLAGNLAGATATAGLVYLSGQYAFGGGLVGANALAMARTKVELGLIQAIALGVLCNALVCLAVWLTLSARSTTDRVVAIVFPISAFVAAGFEHSVANMYIIPLGLLIKAFAPAEFWLAIGQTADQYDVLTWRAMIESNLLPVTFGNVIGGAVMVGATYWFVYLRSAARRGGAP